MSRYANLYVGPYYQINTSAIDSYAEPAIIELENRLYCVSNIDYIDSDATELSYFFIPGQKEHDRYSLIRIHDHEIGHVCKSMQTSDLDKISLFALEFNRELGIIDDFYCSKGELHFGVIYWLT